MSSCNHCGRYTSNTKLGEDCKFCKEVYAQGVADGMRKCEAQRNIMRMALMEIAIRCVQEPALEAERHERIAKQALTAIGVKVE